jgi:dethiobiotin synthetase
MSSRGDNRGKIHKRPPGPKSTSGKILFVTGTDTGVGKTVFTALLLQYFRKHGFRALAMKPFCSGGRGDVELLQSLQPGELSDHDMNPYWYREPVAPLATKEARGKRIDLDDVLVCIRLVQAKCDVLLIEGAGGLLVPLGERLTLANLIARLKGQVVVVARNQLGTINHTLLTVQGLQSIGAQCVTVVLMSSATPDPSSRTNRQILTQLLKPIPVGSVPFLGSRPVTALDGGRHSAAVRNALSTVIRSWGVNP